MADEAKRVTEYVVLREVVIPNRDDTEGRTFWEVLGRGKGSPDQVRREVLEPLARAKPLEGLGSVVTVPSRSWQPRVVRAEQRTVLTFDES